MNKIFHAVVALLLLPGAPNCLAADSSSPAIDGRVLVTPDEPGQLQAGAPLESELTFTRSGKILMLDYKLLDAAGRDFSRSGAALGPPRFVVYKGDREIGSGTFEYG
jgi:hypothetical protein